VSYFGVSCTVFLYGKIVAFFCRSVNIAVGFLAFNGAYLVQYNCGEKDRSIKKLPKAGSFLRGVSCFSQSAYLSRQHGHTGWYDPFERQIWSLPYRCGSQLETILLFRRFRLISADTHLRTDSAEEARSTWGTRLKPPLAGEHKT